MTQHPKNLTRDSGETSARPQFPTVRITIQGGPWAFARQFREGAPTTVNGDIRQRTGQRPGQRTEPYGTGQSDKNIHLQLYHLRGVVLPNIPDLRMPALLGLRRTHDAWRLAVRLAGRGRGHAPDSAQGSSSPNGAELSIS